MKTYLVSLTRGDAIGQYPVERKAANIDEAIISAIKQSYDYQPAKAQSAFCLVSVHQVPEEEGRKFDG